MGTKAGLKTWRTIRQIASVQVVEWELWTGNSVSGFWSKSGQVSALNHGQVMFSSGSLLLCRMHCGRDPGAVA